MIERKWLGNTQAFTTDGTTRGSFTIASIAGIKVKQHCEIRSSTQPTLYLEIKRILGTIVSVGPISASIDERTDLSSYTVADSASLVVGEQARPGIDIKQISRAVYEEEPTVAIRTIQVDEKGNIVGTGGLASNVNVHDGFGNPINSVTIGLDRYLDVNSLISDGTDQLAVNADGSINVNIVTFGAGSAVIFKAAATFTNTAETTVATYVTTVANVLINHIMGDAATMGTWRMYRNSISAANLCAMVRTSEVERNADIFLYQPEKLATIGNSIIVTFQADRYRSAHLGGSAPTFVRIEGSY